MRADFCMKFLHNFKKIAYFQLINVAGGVSYVHPVGTRCHLAITHGH